MMDSWLQKRRSDERFAHELRRVDMGNGSSWFRAPPRVVVTSHHTFAAESDYESKTEPTKKKKKRMKKTDSGGEKSATSDGSDGGVCWSDYERTPNSKEGEKGSCRPKKKKK